MTGVSWEGVGVKPDVAVPARLALIEAHRLAVERLQASATDARQRAGLEAIAEGLAAEKKAAASDTTRALTKAESELLGKYVAVSGAGPGFSLLEKKGTLVLQSTSGRPPFDLRRLRGETYQLDGLPDDFTATFSRTADGKTRLLLQQSNAMPPLVLEK